MKTNETLARRWLASKHWGGWRVGMVDAASGGVCFDTAFNGVPVFIVPDDPLWQPRRFVNALPYLDHPGTRAFLLEDVRRALGEPDAHVYRTAYGWDISSESVEDGERDTEAAALIAALEAAP